MFTSIVSLALAAGAILVLSATAANAEDPPNPPTDFFPVHFDWQAYQYTPAAAVPIMRFVVNEVLAAEADGYPQYLVQCRDNQLDRSVAPRIDEDCYFVHRFDAPYQIAPECDRFGGEPAVASCFTDWKVPGWVEPDRPFPCENARCFLTLSSSPTEIVDRPSHQSYVLFWEILANPYFPYHSPRLDRSASIIGPTTEFSLLEPPAIRPVGVLITTPPSNGTVECTDFAICTYTSTSTQSIGDTFEFVLNFSDPFYRAGIVTIVPYPPVVVPEVPLGILLPISAAGVMAAAVGLRRRTA